MFGIECATCGSFSLPCKCPPIEGTKVTDSELLFNNLMLVLRNIEQELININMNLLEIRRR